MESICYSISEIKKFGYTKTKSIQLTEHEIYYPWVFQANLLQLGNKNRNPPSKDLFHRIYLIVKFIFRRNYFPFLSILFTTLEKYSDESLNSWKNAYVNIRTFWNYRNKKNFLSFSDSLYFLFFKKCELPTLPFIIGWEIYDVIINKWFENF